MAASSPEQPWPVHVVSGHVKGWVEKLGWVWMEGQVVQLNHRPGASMAYAVLRDPNQDASVDLTMFTGVLSGLELQQGHKVVVNAKPEFWVKRGRLSFKVREIRLAGIGHLLAQIEKRKRALAAEGLFDQDRKKPLPFAPGLVGLITGRDSDAKKDVITVATARWPSVEFAIEEVAVQGLTATDQICQALARLENNPKVEVIVIARGGGAVEDLLPFSDEAMIRAVANAHKPIVSAIGHQADSPLLDLVADYRAATPTDAAKHLVPNAAYEATGVNQAISRMTAALQRRLASERQGLAATKSRPVLADPQWIIAARRQEIAALATDSTSTLERILTIQVAGVATLVAKLAALSPQGTLDRGYALVVAEDGQLVTQVEQAPPGTKLRLRLAKGTLAATATKVENGRRK
ncbi:MAG: exodeoxyribonuclease VII large subunit [Micrococcales bacterium]|nr:exodeoxyribonuclease VII large subunit [Micrococcales bacterium]